MATAARGSAIEVRGLDHIVLRVADLEASLKWYKRVLGCEEERRIARFGLYQLRLGNSLIDLAPVGSPLDKGGGAAPGAKKRNLQHFAVQLKRFDEKKIRAHLKRRGIEPGSVERRYGAQGHGPSMYITDPDGNVVELKGPPAKDQAERVEGAFYPSRRRRTARADAAKPKNKSTRSGRT